MYSIFTIIVKLMIISSDVINIYNQSLVHSRQAELSRIEEVNHV